MTKPKTLAVLVALLSGCGLPDLDPATTTALHAAHPPRSFEVETVGQGQGAPLVFIPGLASPGEVWHALVERERRHHRCHVLTLAGFAGRPPVPGPVEAPLVARVVDDLVAYFQEKRIERPILVGHSLGGIIALDLATRHPEAVGGLTIVDALPFLPAAQVPGATPDSMRPQAGALRQALATASPDGYAAFVEAQPLAQMVTRPADVARLKAWMLQSTPLTVGQALYDVFVTDLRPALARLTAPTVVIGTYLGEEPPTTREATLAIFRDQYAAAPSVAIEIADRARHFVMLDEPGWLRERLDDLVARVPRGPSRP